MATLIPINDEKSITHYKFYDEFGRLIEEQDGEGHSTTYELDAFDRRTAVVNALNDRVEAVYDQRDRQIQTIARGVKLSIDDSTAQDLTTRFEYDGRDNRTLTIDANGHTTEQQYDSLGRVINTITFQGNYAPEESTIFFVKRINVLVFQGVQAVNERRQYDAYGNLIAEIDGMGRVKSSVYSGFGQLRQTVDIGGRVTQYDYNRFGERIRETAGNGKNIARRYDRAGRLIEINDLGTNVRTVYTHDILGNRLSEVITADGVLVRNQTYEYDNLSQMTRWADNITGMQLNYQWDARGNLRRVNTDMGYSPNVVNNLISTVLDQLVSDIREIMEKVKDDEGTVIDEIPRYTGSRNDVLRAYANNNGVSTSKYDSLFFEKKFTDRRGRVSTVRADVASNPTLWVEFLNDIGYGDQLQALFDSDYNPNFEFIDHVYEYNNNNQVTLITQNGELWRQYGYDEAGNRITYNDGTNLNTYDYNSLGWVLKGEADTDNTSSWTYDNVGNVKSFRSVINGKTEKNDTYTYWENNRQYRIRDNIENQTTTQKYDLSGRLLQTTVSGESTTNFTYKYNSAGLQTRVEGRGKKTKGTCREYFAIGNIWLLRFVDLTSHSQCPALLKDTTR